MKKSFLPERIYYQPQIKKCVVLELKHIYYYRKHRCKQDANYNKT